MRIDSIPPKELLSQYIHVREKVAVESPAPSIDKAELTSEAKTFSAALKAAKEAIETRTPEEQGRVEKVAQQIADGTYSVPGEKVAQKMFGK
jgi:anti-sigma28 factor (negative regulator of flagellin synthesis)